MYFGFRIRGRGSIGGRVRVSLFRVRVGVRVRFWLGPGPPQLANAIRAEKMGLS